MPYTKRKTNCSHNNRPRRILYDATLDLETLKSIKQEKSYDVYDPTILFSYNLQSLKSAVFNLAVIYVEFKCQNSNVKFELY